MERIAAGIEHGIPGSRVEKRLLQGTQHVFKLWVRYSGVQIKIEPNTVLRGCVYPVVKRDLCEEAQNLFELVVSDVPVLATPDLYGGKFCAALDRQHPRDLYDVKHLLDTTGIGEPNWELMDLPNIEQLPALRWKLLNVQRMTPGKRAAARVKLEQVLAR